MPKPNEESPAEWDQIEIGDQVKHPQWGVGTVLFRSGTGANAKAIVVFPEEGQKKLLLRYAKLKKVGTTTLKSVEKLKAETQPRPHVPAPTELFAEDEEALPLDKEPDEEALLLGDEEEVAGFDDEDESEFEHDDSDEEL